MNYITQDSVWELIINKFKEFRNNENILSQGLPVLKSYKKTQKASQILNWWSEVEQLSIVQTLDYSHMFTTDIQAIVRQEY